MNAPSKYQFPIELACEGLVPLDEILCTGELHRRPQRAPDFESENRALSALLQALAHSPRTILQALADALLEIFDADSAGLSLLAPDGKSFYWPAIAGDWQPHIGGGTPRHFGPCGDVLDRDEPLLFRHWERRYPYLLQATPLAEEGLLVPFYVHGEAVGTIWAIAHDRRRKFDAEDLRQLQSLGRFASVAYETVQLLDEREAAGAALKLREEANRSRQLFRAVVETTPECIKIVAADGSLEYMNPAGLQMIGAGSIDQIRGGCVFDLIVPEHRDQWRDCHERVCRGERLSWQFDLVGSDGLRRHMETHAAPLVRPDGSTAHLGVTRDITERKQREQRLQERDEQLAMAEESAGVGIWTIDMASKTVRGTPQFWRLMGLPPTEEAMPLEATRAVRPPEEASRIRDAFRNAVASGADSFESEYQIRHPDGEVRWIFGRGQVIRDAKGQPVQYTGIDLDITERKQRDQQLRDSERHLHDLLRALPAAVYTTDAEGRINFYNEAAVELAGRKPVMGDQWCVTWKLYYPDGRPLPHDQCPMAVALKEGRPVRGAEAVAERPDGTRVSFIPYPTPLHDSTGKLIGAINMLVDISDRKAAELRLHEAHERLETVLKTARVGLWDADLQNSHLTVSPTCKANFGLPPDAEFTHETMFAAMHPEDRPLFDAARRRALAGEAPYEVEYRNFWPDGTQHWIFTRATILRDMDGTPTQISGLSVDVTERRRAEQALRTSEERLARLLHLTPLGIVEIAPKGKIVYANAAAERILRLTQSDIQSRQYDEPDWQVTTPDGESIPPRSLAPAQALRGRNVVAQEVAIVSGDGERVVISVNAMPLREPGGGVSGALVAFSDVTARYVAESALKESEERFRALANNISQLAWMANPEGWIFWYNQRWYDYTGTTPAEMEGWGWQAVHDPEALPRVLERWRAALDSGTPFEMTFPLRGKDGKFRPFLTRVSPVHDDTGRITRWFGTNTDVSEQRQIEEALRASEERLRSLNENLETRVREEVAERERVQRELLQVQKLEAIGQLTGGIAHDFNNLLTAIIGNLEVLKAGPNTAKSRRNIDAATRAAERGASLTQQLLAYARKQYLVSRAVDLNQLILNMDELLNRSLGGLVKVEMQLADGLWYAESDPTQLELAILNLAINARDAMTLGGSLYISTQNVASAELLPADLPPGDYVYLQMSDTGEGMSPDVLSKAMEPFFTTKEVGKGSGLGLAQVYGVVKQCGGTIRIESVLENGTTVRIWLPRTHQVPIEVRDGGNSLGHDVETAASVLVVDDDPDVRAITVEILRGAGYGIQEAESAHRALDFLDRGLRVDVALVDYAMPRMSGTEFVIAARERRPNLPVIYITGYAEPAGVADETNAVILRKPYRSADLLRAVRTTLDQRGQRLTAANVVSIQPSAQAETA